MWLSIREVTENYQGYLALVRSSIMDIQPTQDSDFDIWPNFGLILNLGLKYSVGGISGQIPYIKNQISVNSSLELLDNCCIDEKITQHFSPDYHLQDDLL